VTSESHRDLERATRLIDYLLEIARIRSKTVRQIDDYEKVLWLCDVPRDNSYCYCRAWGQGENQEDDTWLEVIKFDEPLPANTPNICEPWVNEESLFDEDEIPDLAETIPSNEPDAQPLQLKEHPRVQEAWEKYILNKWIPWTDEHKEWSAVHKAYSTLFAIHQEQQKLGEEYELCLALGLLTWRPPSGPPVRRHVLTARASLFFEPVRGRFVVGPASDGAQLDYELDMLEIPDQPVNVKDSLLVELSKADDDPWDERTRDSVIKTILNSLSGKGLGEYSPTFQPSAIKPKDKPVMEYAPALVLRKRSVRGLELALTNIREQLNSTNHLPSQFCELFEVESKFERSEVDPGIIPDTNAHRFYLPKPYNNEQLEIIQKLNSTSGILVQGPPGTGKSHTIANLICHLLATGKRVLVTAKTPRALQVLHEKLPAQARPLCISLLGTGIDERKSLETSVNSILAKHDRWSSTTQRSRIEKLEARIDEVNSEKAKTDNKLRALRESETYTHSIAGDTYTGTAARIAERVNMDARQYTWFTDHVSHE